MFTISRAQKWCLKNRTSTPTTPHDGYQREHVQHDGCLSSHCFVLLCAPE